MQRAEVRAFSISWTWGTRGSFPLLSHMIMLVCDTRVVSSLRQNSFGNSSFQLQGKKLTGQHHEVWLQRTAHYLTDCQTQQVLPQKCGDPLPLPSVPKAAWLLTVYCRDVLARLEEVKASITATFGRVLMIDSTKKVYYYNIDIFKCTFTIPIPNPPSPLL